MGEPKAPRNRDLDIPTRTGEELGEQEPLAPRPQPEQGQDAPVPEEETYERDRERQPPTGEEAAH
jgi:hypothetical protein